jgi:hypothetical protein
MKTVKGKVPKRPPLTSEARHTLSEIEAKIGLISMSLENLSEPALKGLAYEANRMAKVYGGVRSLWSAIAQEADREREIKARHRTGKGVFYAVVHVWHEHSPNRRPEVDTVEARCKGKKAAVEAARRLLADNAHRFSEDVTIEAQVVSELEWSPIADEKPGEDGPSSTANSA